MIQIIVHLTLINKIQGKCYLSWKFSFKSKLLFLVLLALSAHISTKIGENSFSPYSCKYAAAL